MADTISSDRRSKNISHFKSKDTSIELMVRRCLFAMGYRYRVNYKKLPGKPDIVFTKKKIAIFIHGCYWHDHDCGSRYAHSRQSTRHTGSSKSSEQSNEIRNTFKHLRLTVGRSLCFGSVKLRRILNVVCNRLLPLSIYKSRSLY